MNFFVLLHAAQEVPCWPNTDTDQTPHGHMSWNGTVHSKDMLLISTYYANPQEGL